MRWHTGASSSKNNTFMYQVSIVYLPVPMATDDHHLLKLQAVWHRRVSLQKQLKTRGGVKQSDLCVCVSLLCYVSHGFLGTRCSHLVNYSSIFFCAKSSTRDRGRRFKVLLLPIGPILSRLNAQESRKQGTESGRKNPFSKLGKCLCT